MSIANVSSSQMSFHRVLPLLPVLSNQDQWAIQPDPLLRSKIMADNTAAEQAVSRNHDISRLAPKSSSPAEEQGLTSAGEDDLEYESPPFRGRSLSQTPHAGNRSSKTSERSPEDEALSSWQRDSPSSICLCQPDPKVPRPRNGT